MKIIRYRDFQDTIKFGCIGADGSEQRLDGDLFKGLSATGETAHVKTLLAPIDPVAVFGIGLNYRQHATESGMSAPAEPVVFMKPPSALQRPGGPIEIPRQAASHEVDYEVELAVVIGRPAKNVTVEKALNYVLGYTCANDVSARDWQIKRGGGQWCRGKMFDTFLPLGPSLVTTDELPDPQDLKLRSRVNGQIRQDWTTADMIFDVATLISFLSASSTLHPGTVILTGTPHGVGMGFQPPRWLKPHDRVEVEIDGIGTLTNPVVLEPRTEPASTR
ncbi:fumarylacetoacetate hydrolase family protein [Synoicihabitans lomoniglobus]|uniref:Fumarylacetoacetate hydrolase family protein n=1 Tax=Synoicihabitans lomoniglobus TaxID=2909285 RepID=A0AAF0CN79_9BACT|nr:fumarylacetoacetate hydrolase family protein [Opitutaceae bacterium LMO-M01]WED64085.1 fumarylacetoacetate hydrolase family protein [Opitutaceae bacterium LMO-M01]